MESKKTVREFASYRQTIYKKDTNKWHREDGPAFVREYRDGTRAEEWWQNDAVHRYGGPAIFTREGKFEYYLHDIEVTEIVEEWLSEREYAWAKMTDIEKWELELFMRSLG